MKANTQYNDFVGTSAADLSDQTDLTSFLEKRNIDIERYQPIGARFYHEYMDFFTAAIICIDKSQTTEENPFITQIHFEHGISRDDFFNLFKRFDVIVTRNHFGHKAHDINKTITVDPEGQIID